MFFSCQRTCFREYFIKTFSHCISAWYNGHWLCWIWPHGAFICRLHLPIFVWHQSAASSIRPESWRLLPSFVPCELWLFIPQDIVNNQFHVIYKLRCTLRKPVWLMQSFVSSAKNQWSNSLKNTLNLKDTAESLSTFNYVRAMSVLTL